MDNLKIEQQQGLITTNLDAIEAEIKEKMADYKDYLVTEDSIKADKKVLADLRKTKKELDDARKEVKKIGSRLSSKKIKLVAGKKVYEYIAEKGYSREFGARNIARTAENLVATPLVDEILFGSLSKGGTVTVSVDSEGEGLSFEYGGLKNAAK